MELLQQYDNLSNDNNVNILGISLINEIPQQWEPLTEPKFQTGVTRLMVWMTNETWNPILNNGTLFLGIVHNPSISAVTFRLMGHEYDAKIVNGYWRCTDYPLPLDCIKDIVEVKVDTDSDAFELAWLIVPSQEHQNILAKLEIQEF